MDTPNASDELKRAEQRIKTLETKLRLQNEKLESIIENVPDPMVIFNKDGAVDILNKAALDSLKLLGLNPQGISGIDKFVEFFDAEDRVIPIWEVPPVRIIRGETLKNLRIKAKFGQDFSYIDFSGSPIRDENGEIAYSVMCFRNVTEQVNTEEQYFYLVEFMQSGVVHHDADGTIISMNRAAELILGKSPAELVGNTALRPNPPPLKPDGTIFTEAEHPAMMALRTGKPNRNTVMGVYNPVLQEYRWVIISAVPLFRVGEVKPYQVFTVFDDITDHKKASDALAQSEAHLRSVLDHSSDITYCYNIQTNLYEYISPACEKVLGYTAQEFMAMDLDTVHALIHEDDRCVFGPALERELEEKAEAALQYRHRTKSGDYRWLSTRLSLVRDEAGCPLYRNGSMRDVTESMMLEDALRESEMHLRLAAQGGELGTYAINLVDDKVFISDELKALWGLKPGEQVELGENSIFFRGLHPGDEQEFIEKINRSNDPNSDGTMEMDYRVIGSDGVIKWLHARGQTLFAGEGGNRRPVYSTGVVFDVTNRVDAENNIRELSEELRNIIESTDDFIWSVDKEYRLVSFNSSFARYIKSKFRHHLKKGLSMKQILTPQSGALWEDLYRRTARDGKFQVEMKTDKGFRVMSYSFHPVYIDAELVEITIFGRDVTERLNSEREIIRLNTTLEKRVAERTEELQKSVRNLQNLSRMISHDLKEPIREIETYIAQIEKNADVLPNVLKIRKTCATMNKMIEDLSKYAMSSEHKIHKETVNVKNMVVSIYNDLKSAMPNRSVLQFESGLPRVCADKALLRQALLNLLSNAMKFSWQKEPAEITVGCAEENGHYVFHIRDNGAGFDMQYAHKLFNIFERLHTKEEFEGTGIGLAAVRNIIGRHGGRTWIESEKDIGTVVYFSLPANADNI